MDTTTLNNRINSFLSTLNESDRIFCKPLLNKMKAEIEVVNQTYYDIIEKTRRANYDGEFFNTPALDEFLDRVEDMVFDRVIEALENALDDANELISEMR